MEIRQSSSAENCGCTLCIVAKGSGKVRIASKEVSKGKVLRLHTVFRVLTQSEDLVSSLRSIYSGTCG